MKKRQYEENEETDCVLMVDNEPLILEMYSDFIRECGYNVITALSPMDGLKLMTAHNVSLVITDFKMPGMDGMAFCSLIKEKYHGMPVVILSAFAEEARACLYAADMGADELLNKPCSIEDIKSVLGRFIKRESLQDMFDENDFEHMTG